VQKAGTGGGRAVNKAEMRKKYLEKRKSLLPEERRKADMEICRNLGKISEIDSRSGICAYVSDGTEPDLKGFLEEKRKNGTHIYFPESLGEREHLNYEMAEPDISPDLLPKGAFGIPEPPKGSRVLPFEDYKNVVWLVPGVAFDKAGRRLGRGKAVYDRLLESGVGLTIGVLYECQLCESVPCEGHDVKMDMLVTEKGVFRCALKTGE